MRNSIAGARMEKIENAGHGRYVEAAEAFNAKLDEFMTSVEKASQPR